jgi:chromosome segregation ATPase
MTDQQTSPITLEDVRARFLETESKLREATAAVEELRSGAEGMATTRETLAAASRQLSELSTALTDVAGSLAENADQLRQGVDALRLSDPAEVRRQLDELAEAVAANQVVNSERLDQLEISARAATSEAGESTSAWLARNRLEARIGFLVVAGLALIAIAISLVVTPA